MRMLIRNLALSPIKVVLSSGSTNEQKSKGIVSVYMTTCPVCGQGSQSNEATGRATVKCAITLSHSALEAPFL